MYPSPEVRSRTDNTPRNRPATFCFSVHADDDVSILPRVCGVLAKRGLTPERLVATRFRHGRTELHVDFQVESLDHPSAELIASEMRRIVTSRLVLISEK